MNANDVDVSPVRLRSLQEGERIFVESIDLAAKTTADARRAEVDRRCDSFRRACPTCGRLSAG